jgi:hypothetical protein
MAPYSSPAVRRPLASRAFLAAALATIALGAHACDRVPLLAPSGSAISLTSVATASSTDSITITALVLEGAAGAPAQNGSATTTTGVGTPVHNGTVVSFTTTIGTITPVEAKTVNGKVTVTFTGDGRVGAVVITATSGSAVKTLQITLSAPTPLP